MCVSAWINRKNRYLSASPAELASECIIDASHCQLPDFFLICIAETRYAVLRPIINPGVAKAGGLQSQDGKGEAVMHYREPLTTQDLESSDFPERVNNMVKLAQSFESTPGQFQATL